MSLRNKRLTVRHRGLTVRSANQYGRSRMTSRAVPHAIGLDLTHPIIY